MVRDELVRRKLSQLTSFLDELAVHQDVTLDEYVRPGGPRRAIERLVQLVVEAAVDINVHIATEEAGTPPPDYRSSFLAASARGVFPGALAERLAPSAGLRNALVHEYADVDDAKVQASIPEVLDGFREYAGHVLRWLEARA